MKDTIVEDQPKQEAVIEQMVQKYIDVKFKEHGNRTVADAMWEVSEGVDRAVTKIIKDIFAVMGSDDTHDEIRNNLSAAGLEANDVNTKSVAVSITMSVILSTMASLQADMVKVVMCNASSAMLVIGKDFDKIRDGVDSAFTHALTKGKESGMSMLDQGIRGLK